MGDQRPVGMPEAPGHLGHGKGGGVAGEDRLFGDQILQPFEEILLGREILPDRLDDEIGSLDGRFQLGDDLDPVEHRLRIQSRGESQPCLLIQVGADPVLQGFSRLSRGIVGPDEMAGRGKDLGDPVPHGPQAKYGDTFCRHWTQLDPALDETAAPPVI